MASGFPYPTVLLTGATGSFGRACAQHLLATAPGVKLRAYSRDERKQSQLQEHLGSARMSYLLGDIRDLERLRLACRNVTLIIHAAALKHVPALEYNPDEAWKTNILGTSNVIRAAIDCGVHQALLLSSDKAVAPVNSYGATKLVAERLWIQANSYAPQGTAFSLVRYGNIAASRGSVLETYRRCLAQHRPLPITTLDMTRFWYDLPSAVRLVLQTATQRLRGAVLVPHLPAFSLLDLCRAVLGRDAESPLVADRDYTLVGIRPGEKRHEQLLSAEEVCRAWWRTASDVGTAYCLPPLVHDWAPGRDPGPSAALGWQAPPAPGLHVPCEGPESLVPLPYTSDAWPWRLTVAELRARLARLEEGDDAV